MRSKSLVLFVLGGSFLGASAAKADEVGFIDCANHPDNTQVLAKAAKTDEVVASLPCGERFTVLQTSFFFSKVQTKDGKVGFILTNSISRDYSVSAAPQAMPPLAPAKAARSGNPFSSIAAALKPKQQQGLRLPPDATAAPAVTPAPTPEAKTSAQVQSNSATVSASQPVPTASAAATVAVSPAETTPAAVQSAAAANDASASALFPAKTQIVVQGEPTGVATPQAKSADTPAVAAANASASVTAQAPATVRGVTIQGDLKETQTAAAPANFPDKTGVVVQPESNTAAQPAISVPLQPDPSAVAQPESAATRPEPEPAQPQPTPAFHRSAWEKPRRDTRNVPLIELFGGFAYARLDNGAGGYSNVNGALGSFGWNAKPWLQVVGDTSYNTITTNGVKSVLYGNHYGPRLFWRRRGRWGIAPFAEGLIGGSRADTTVSGVSGYKTSQNCISYKVGGGLDLKPSRYVEIRVLNVDYYRTSFGTNLTQTNYWASAGIVLRLFGGGSE